MVSAAAVRSLDRNRGERAGWGKAPLGVGRGGAPLGVGWRGATLVVGALVLSACGGSEAVTKRDGVTIDVDAAAPGTPLRPIWAYHGYDEVNYTTSPEGRALLAELVAAHRARVHVRTHFLFNSGDGTPAMKWGSTNVYTEDPSGNAVYDWALTDEILDTLVSTGASPFVELGFMPEALSSNPKPYRNTGPTVLNGGCFYPPKDYARWGDLVRTWATHASTRYPDAAPRWPWELWNEPDSAYWHGTFEEYAKLYDHTEAALHAAIPGAALGGPAVIHADGPFLRQFLDHCDAGTNAVTGERGTRLDFVSFHAKGGAELSGDHVELDLGNQLRLHLAGFQAVAAFPRFARTPIYITEADPDGCAACSPSIVPGAAYRNLPAYGAYVAAMMKRTLELEASANVNVQGVLTWAFTFPGSPYFAGYRVLSTNGIDLPVFAALRLLGRLFGDRVPLTSDGSESLANVLEHGVRGEPDIDGMAARDGSTIRVLVWNYHDHIVTAPSAPVRLRVRLPSTFGDRARVSRLRVDDTHGNAYALWLSQGSPQSPSADEVAALREAMLPTLDGPEQLVNLGPQKTVSVEFDLPRFGVTLVTVEPGL